MDYENVFTFKKQDDMNNELDYLEQIYNLVKLDETIKFNGKVYKRIRPINNKFRKYPYHFCCINQNIYNGSVLVNDKNDEFVNFICNYKAIIVD